MNNFATAFERAHLLIQRIRDPKKALQMQLRITRLSHAGYLVMLAHLLDLPHPLAVKRPSTVKRTGKRQRQTEYRLAFEDRARHLSAATRQAASIAGIPPRTQL